MLKLSGYAIDKLIYESQTTQVYKADRDNDKHPVVVKYLCSEFPSRHELSKFRQEYKLLEKLKSHQAIISVYDLIQYSKSYAIIMQDIGGRSVLETIEAKQLSLEEKLKIAIGMTCALQQVHEENIIHKDVNPSNFIWNIETENIAIIDFGIAIELSQENQAIMDQNLIEGTFHYMSPEQTGRVNRAIDYRTDLYSLGASFYELFSGQKVFAGNDEVEIIYSHIAKEAVELCDINSQIPTAVSDVVKKLLAKITENRYQSTAGVIYDLEFCLSELKKHSEIRQFKIGQRDISSKFQIPQKLYGRKEEISAMKDQFNRISTEGIGLMLISGYSGLGKTSLVHELQQSIVSKNGYYVFGKFEELERDVPYKAFSQAFSSLIRQVLLRSEETLNAIKKRLHTLLGPNGNIIVELVPEVEELIGKQPEVEALNPRETQNRFQIVFKDFLKAFAAESHPLVIFLDDLQWSDLSTLDALSFLLNSSDIKGLLLIGAYRQNEVDTNHPLMQLIKKIENDTENKIVELNHISLKPLHQNDVNQLIADTLVSPPDKTRELSKLIFQKTKGNPFFINQILTSLYRKKVFQFNTISKRWEWSQDKIEKEEISDNVIEFLIDRYSSLSVSTQNVLKNCSCFGTRFSFKSLSFISKQSDKTLAKALWIALENEIILPLDHNYYLIKPENIKELASDIDIHFCFHHDRIQQSIYSLMPENYKPRVHLKIGRLLLKHYSKKQQQKNIFDLLYHLNIGKNEIKSKAERSKLIHLNYQAGQKAKSAAAYATAVEYFYTAKSFIPSDDWVSDYTTYFEISREIVESTFLSGSIAEALSSCHQLSLIAKNRYDKGAVYSLETLILEFSGEQRERILENLRKGLELFDIDLPSDPEEINQKVDESIGRWMAMLEKYPIEKLHELPVATENDKIVIINLLFQAIPAAIQCNFPLFLYIELFIFDLAITHGTTPVCSKVFADCGLIMGSILGHYDDAYKLGEAAFRLIDKHNANSMKCSVYFIFSVFLSHWRVHYQEGLDYFDLSRKMGLESGDLQHATYSCAHKLYRLFYVGKNLEEYKQEIERDIIFLQDTKSTISLFLVKIVLHFVDKMLNSFENDEEMAAADLTLFEEVKASNNLFFLYMFGQLNTIFYYYIDDMDNAGKWLSFTEPYFQGGIGHFSFPDYYLFQSLILVKKWKISDKIEQGKIKATLEENLKKLKIWSDNCADNFAHKYHLLAAQIATIDGKSIEDVTSLYKKVHISTKDNDFTHLRALANELEANYWFARGYEKIGKVYMQEAYYLYKQWGAIYKIHNFEHKYSGYITSLDKGKTAQKRESSTSILIDGSFFEVNAIIKAMQAISSEIKVERLLKTLTRIIIENAGAQQGALLLKNESDGKFYIEAQKRDESDEIEVLQSLDFHKSDRICAKIVQYVIRSEQSVVLDNAKTASDYQTIPYIQENNIVSVLCLPIIYHNVCKGLVYLENNLSEHVFTPDRLEITKILSSQVFISIENAQLYENLEAKVIERTELLKIANEKLKELSLQDPLTKLYNRRYLHEFRKGVSKNF